ncbi:MAG: DUF2382 domain-containing protein [Rubrobacter sp.]|nr:DUF2382 domain-containing protein [Rubrobacter sp.]
MAKKPPVHVLPRKDGWAVVREGNERATSVHRTQAEAAEVGREVARKDRTAFLLHAKDGHVRDRSDYGGGPSPPKERPEGAVAGVASAATRATGAAVGLASGVVEGAVEGLGRAETGSMPAEDRADDTPGEGSDASKEEVGRLAYEERHADYEAYDQLGKRFAMGDTLFLDEEEELEYVGVKKDRSSTESALIIPAEVVTVDDERGRMVVARSNNVVEQGPTLADEEAATPEFEERVRIHYGLDSAARSGTYGEYHEGPPEESVGAGTSGGEGSSASASSGGAGEEEIRVQRSEEELVVGTREREAGSVKVRKRVRTDRERVDVPVKHEEVSVERVPGTGEASGAQIGEEEVSVPVTEEEVVVDKRAVAKEEVRVRKEVVEDTEVVEEDVRREEVDVEDATEYRDV